jgi:CRISPR-associated protein (TIGR03986 family)
LSWLKADRVREGQRVEFDIVEVDKGLRAANLKVIESALNANPRTETNDLSGYRFLNPYNFVRNIEKPRPDSKILGNCSPPPHDRYIGMTGHIKCIAKTKTPLFISDSHEIREINGHKTFRFFQYEGKPALPASSLRGMIRLVFETVTNSCFAVFQRDEPYTLEHRIPRAPEDMIPARVLKLDENGAQLELLDCTVNPLVSIPSGPSVVRAGAVLSSYPPRVLLDRRTKQPFAPSDSQLPEGASDGMRIAALVTKDPQKHKSRRFRSFHAVQVVPASQHELLREDHGYAKVFGWLHLTGPNIENKHDERLFFRWDDRDINPPELDKIPHAYLCECDNTVIAEFNHHLNGYWERLGKIVKRLGDQRWPNSTNDMPQPSSFIKKNSMLTVGDLVYAKVKRAPKCTAKILRAVSMPRLPYAFPREKFLFGHLKNCRNHQALCPACRVFGWVDNKPLTNVKPTAYASRVRLSYGELTSNKGFLPDTRLAILSTPKPTTTSFYLLNKQGMPDPTVDYDKDEARLRGRKFYRHHAMAVQEEYTGKGKEGSDQDRTVHRALDEGATFGFSVEFENLAPLELGALLYALELEEGMFHRLGYAKPLGFGSIKITIDSLQMIDWNRRLNSLDSNAGWYGADKTTLKDNFLKEMRSIYPDDFDNVLSDLRALLRMPPNLPIHYPRPTKSFNPDHPQFEWFMGNKKRQEEGFALDIAANDTRGLPTIDKNGEIE